MSRRADVATVETRVLHTLKGEMAFSSEAFVWTDLSDVLLSMSMNVLGLSFSDHVLRIDPCSPPHSH